MAQFCFKVHLFQCEQRAVSGEIGFRTVRIWPKVETEFSIVFQHLFVWVCFQEDFARKGVAGKACGDAVDLVLDVV